MSNSDSASDDAHKLKRVWEPLQLGKLNLRNRILQPAHSSQHGDPRDHVFSDRQVAYFKERAKGGVALSVTETVAAARSALGSFYHVVDVYNEACIPSMERLGEAVHEHDGRIMVQLASMGVHDRGRMFIDRARPVWGASRIPSLVHNEIPMVMGAEECAQLAQDFVRVLAETGRVPSDRGGGPAEAPGRRQVARRAEAFVFEGANGFTMANVGVGEEAFDVVDGAEGGTFFTSASDELHAFPFLDFIAEDAHQLDVVSESRPHFLEAWVLDQLFSAENPAERRKLMVLDDEPDDVAVGCDDLEVRTQHAREPVEARVSVLDLPVEPPFKERMQISLNLGIRVFLYQQRTRGMLDKYS